MANRFSPSVLPDTEPRSRPGLEIADAIETFRQVRNEEQDRGTAAEDRARRMKREDISDAVTEVEFEKFIRDELGGRPAGAAAAPGAPQEAPGGVGPTPAMTRPLFEDARLGLQREARGPDPEEGTVAVLPGQFMGGQFAQDLVRVPSRRSLAGRDFELDPSQTAAARGGLQEAEKRRQDIEALVAAGIDPARAEAMLRTSPGAIESHLELQDTDAARRSDPLKNEFESEEAREAFLDFRARLAGADRTGQPGARPGDGPIDVEDALAELDQMFGEFDRSGNLVGHALSQRERLRLATLWSEGRLRPEDLPEQPSEEEGRAAPEEGPGFIKRMMNRINPRVDAMGRPTPKADADGLPVGAARAGMTPSPSTGAVPSTGGTDIAVDSIKSITRDFGGKIAPARLREILLEEGFTPEQIQAATGA